MRRLPAFVCLSLLAGCGSLFESKLPVTTVYVLSTAPSASSEPPNAAVSADISIGHPIVTPGLDTERIAIVRGNELQYYAGATWGSTTSQVMGAFLVGSFQNQQLFRSVAPEDARAASDYLLDIEVTAFQAEYGSEAVPTVRVALVGRIIRVKDRRLVATIPVEASQRASQNHMTAVVAAFEIAAREVAIALAQKSAAQLIKTEESERS